MKRTKVSGKSHWNTVPKLLKICALIFFIFFDRRWRVMVLLCEQQELGNLMRLLNESQCHYCKPWEKCFMKSAHSLTTFKDFLLCKDLYIFNLILAWQQFFLQIQLWHWSMFVNRLVQWSLLSLKVALCFYNSTYHIFCASACALLFLVNIIEKFYFH